MLSLAVVTLRSPFPAGPGAPSQLCQPLSGPCCGPHISKLAAVCQCLLVLGISLPSPPAPFLFCLQVEKAYSWSGLMCLEEAHWAKPGQSLYFGIYKGYLHLQSPFAMSHGMVPGSWAWVGVCPTPVCVSVFVCAPFEGMQMDHLDAFCYEENDVNEINMP